MGSIIKVEHLSYVYNPGMPNAVTALDDVSFEVEEGDFVNIDYTGTHHTVQLIISVVPWAILLMIPLRQVVFPLYNIWRDIIEYPDIA